MDIKKIEKRIREIYQEMFDENYNSGNPRTPPHTHNGIDNLVLPKTSNGATPGGVDGDVQINASGVFGTIGGLNLDQTGNARGTPSLDFQAKRSGVTHVASGNYSTIFGAYMNTASGAYSSAFGAGNVSSQNFATTLGAYNTASGSNSTAAGYSNTATGTNSSSFGDANHATATGASALGGSNTASNTDATAVGWSNTASGDSSIALGIGNTASALRAVAIGVSVNNGTADSMEFGVNNSNKLRYNSDGNLGLNTTSYSGGKAVLAILNAATIPTGSPTAGGVLYSTGGALHWLGSSGTDTPIAPA